MLAQGFLSGLLLGLQLGLSLGLGLASGLSLGLGLSLGGLHGLLTTLDQLLGRLLPTGLGLGLSLEGLLAWRERGTWVQCGPLLGAKGADPPRSRGTRQRRPRQRDRTRLGESRLPSRNLRPLGRLDPLSLITVRFQGLLPPGKLGHSGVSQPF